MTHGFKISLWSFGALFIAAGGLVLASVLVTGAIERDQKLPELYTETSHQVVIGDKGPMVAVFLSPTCSFCRQWVRTQLPKLRKDAEAGMFRIAIHGAIRNQRDRDILVSRDCLPAAELLDNAYGPTGDLGWRGTCKSNDWTRLALGTDILATQDRYRVVGEPYFVVGDRGLLGARPAKVLERMLATQ